MPEKRQWRHEHFLQNSQAFWHGNNPAALNEIWRYTIFERRALHSRHEPSVCGGVVEPLETIVVRLHGRNGADEGFERFRLK